MKCKQTKQDGFQCQANAMLDDHYCFSHNPKTKDLKHQAAKQGGLAPKPRKAAKKLPAIKIEDADSILALLENTINQVRTEPITHQKANCIGYLANIAIKALEVGKFDERLKQLEKLMDEKN